MNTNGATLDSGSDPAGASAPLILVVDDYPDNRELVAEILAYSGFRTAQAENGREALEKARELLPDLMLLDLALPVMDGWEVTRTLRGEERTRGLRIVALTAHAQQSFLERAIEAGCDAVITKPFPPDKLVPKINELLALGGAERAHTRGG